MDFSDYCDEDNKCGSPQLKAINLHRSPSPSPPPAFLPDIRQNNGFSHSDALLVLLMDGGKRPDIARQAGAQPLGSDNEDDEESMKRKGVIIDAQNALRAHEGQTAQSSLQPEIKTAEREVPPILPQSPQSNLSNIHANAPITLPSISDQLGDIIAKARTTDSAISQSSPSYGPRSSQFPAIPGLRSLPKSPHDVLRPQLPLPGRRPPYSHSSNVRRPSQTEGGQCSSAEYSKPSNSTNTEIPSTDTSTPSVAIDRTSISDITNSQISGFQCPYPGCTAQPFQTEVSSIISLRIQDLIWKQWLLQSHASVHSSNRPHYCSVKGCPKSKVGFKRKNELIRHGLVHESLNYVCPFCPNRRCFPRPDNLQR